MTGHGRQCEYATDPGSRPSACRRVRHEIGQLRQISRRTPTALPQRPSSAVSGRRTRFVRFGRGSVGHAYRQRQGGGRSFTGRRPVSSSSRCGSCCWRAADAGQSDVAEACGYQVGAMAGAGQPSRHHPVDGGLPGGGRDGQTRQRALAWAECVHSPQHGATGARCESSCRLTRLFVTLRDSARRPRAVWHGPKR